ncbi:MAG: hypothetical protein JSV97_13210 [candidate division WOR-3 bacterium]|nr:MAG: hypothetical protein JSV97_13210 [candidate division WOR-3 bacterium]
MKFFVIVLIVCLFYGQDESSEKAPLVVTITPIKHTYNIQEKWIYEIRIENISSDILRIPKNIDKHYIPKMIGSDGRAIPWKYVILAMGYFDEHNTIELAPGYFYGEKCSWTGPPDKGEYTFHILYISPINIGDSLPHYWSGQVKSNEVGIIIK